MSPRDEIPSNLSAFLAQLRSKDPSIERLVDPQFHIGTVWPANDEKLRAYGHYVPHLGLASFSATGIQSFVGATLRWQAGLDVSAVVSPTVMVDDLNSRWSHVAMMLAQESLLQHDGSKPLLISIIVGEDALRHRALVDTWLDELTTLEADGFYLVVRRSLDTYRQHYDPDVLAALLHTCYSLASINQFRVFVGYTDMITLLLHSVGVTATAAGWFTGLKQFTTRRFEPPRGGRQPRARYSSRPLLNSIYMTELDAIYNAGHVGTVLSNTQFDNRFNGNTNPENVNWPSDDAALQHWGMLAETAQSSFGSTVSTRLDSAVNTIGIARVIYAQATTLVPFAFETGDAHLDQWLEALNRFRADAGV